MLKLKLNIILMKIWKLKNSRNLKSNLLYKKMRMKKKPIKKINKIIIMKKKFLMKILIRMIIMKMIINLFNKIKMNNMINIKNN